MTSSTIQDLTLAPLWASLKPEKSRGFLEAWYVKLNDPMHQRALWLRFSLLSSANGFKRVAEVWGTYFQRKDNREVQKVALKQTFDIEAFDKAGVRVGDCELTEQATRGSIQSKGKTIRWDLGISSAQNASFNPLPEPLTKLGIVRNRMVTLGEDLRFNGTVEIDGEKQEWIAAPGIEGHFFGPRSAHSWTWAHCNAFVDDQGVPASFVFEGLSARAKLAGSIPSPRVSSFYFVHQGQEYRFNSLWSSLVHSRSHATPTEWEFQVEHGELRFRGHLKAEHRDFAGITHEDTDGSLLYCAASKLSDLTIWIYRRGKLEATLRGPGTAAFEVVSRDKNPYVPLLI